MALSNFRAHTRAARLIAADFGRALLQFSIRPYAAARHHDSSYTCFGYPDEFFFRPSAALQYAKGAMSGQGHVTSPTEKWIVTRQTGVRKTWIVPSGLRARLGHQNV